MAQTLVSRAYVVQSNQRSRCKQSNLWSIKVPPLYEHFFYNTTQPAVSTSSVTVGHISSFFRTTDVPGDYQALQCLFLPHFTTCTFLSRPFSKFHLQTLFTKHFLEIDFNSLGHQHLEKMPPSPISSVSFNNSAQQITPSRLALFFCHKGVHPSFLVRNSPCRPQNFLNLPTISDNQNQRTSKLIFLRKIMYLIFDMLGLKKNITIQFLILTKHFLFKNLMHYYS